MLIRKKFKTLKCAKFMCSYYYLHSDFKMHPSDIFLGINTFYKTFIPYRPFGNISFY